MSSEKNHIVFYNIEEIWELGIPTKTYGGEMFKMLDMPKLIFPIFVNTSIQNNNKLIYYF